MTKHLLDEATPLPWRGERLMTKYGHGYFHGQPDERTLRGRITRQDMALIDHAVNKLPAHQDAAEALAQCVNAISMTFTSVRGPEPHWCPRYEGHEPACAAMLDGLKAGRAALARLRGSPSSRGGASCLTTTRSTTGSGA